MMASSYLNAQQSKFRETVFQLMKMPSNNVNDNDNEAFKQQMNYWLDLLNSFDFGTVIVDDQIGEQLLRHCASSVPHSCEHLVTKLCPLIGNLLRRQQLSLTHKGLTTLLHFSTKALRECSPWVQPYALHSLGILLYGNSGRVEEFFEDFVGPKGLVLQIATDWELDLETRRCALRCLENLSLRTSSTEYLRPDQVQRCLHVFLQNLNRSTTNSTTANEASYCRILASALLGIQNLILGARLSELSVLGEMLAVLKCLMFYCLRGHSNRPPVHCLYPSPLSQSFFAAGFRDEQVPSPGAKVTEQSSRICTAGKKRATKRKGSERNREEGDGGDSLAKCEREEGEAGGSSSPVRRHDSRLRPFWPKLSSSDSDYSDSEAGNVIRLRSLQSRVRQCSMATLAAAFKTVDRKVAFGYWSSFLPDAPASSSTLISSLLKDPAPKVRSGALVVLTTMLEGSRQFLSLADERERTSKAAFTTLSATLAATLCELHRNLILALVSETSPLVLTQVVKCVTMLVQNAPVHRLARGFLAKLAFHLRPLVTHRDPNVCVAALTAFGAILSIQPALPEVAAVMFDDDDDVPMATDATIKMAERKFNSRSLPWLMSLCLSNVDPVVKATPLPVRIESLQVLAVLVRGHFEHVGHHLQCFADVIGIGLQESDASLKLHSAKLLEELGRSSSSAKLVFAAGDDKQGGLTIVHVWTSLLATTFPQMLQDGAHPLLQAKGCDCLSTMSAEAFSRLPLKGQVLCQTLLLGLSGDEDKGVKAAATRALGIFVLYPTLLRDFGFVADVSYSLVAALDDPSLEVRLKAAWALANVTDSLVLHRDSGTGECCEQPPDSLLVALFESAHAASSDNDRVRSNGVRALGNLLRYLGASHHEKEDFSHIVQRSIDILVKCTTVGSNMKTRWNACYALGNSFRSRELLAKIMPSRVDVLMAISLVAKTCKNFKVRINAAAALSVPSERYVYGTTGDLATIFEHLLDGLENIQASMNFVEYQHKDSLAEQLCTSLCHLIGLLFPDDLQGLSDVVEPYCRTLQSYLCRCTARDESVPKLFGFKDCHRRALKHLADVKRGSLSSARTVALLENLETLIKVNS